MARSTLSFFSRLLSSKKKNILKMRDEEKFQNEDGIKKSKNIDSLSKISEETRDKYIQSSIGKEAKNVIQTVDHKSFPPISDNEVDDVCMIYSRQEELAHKYGKDTNNIVSIVKTSEKCINSETEISKILYEEKSINQKDSEFYTSNIEESLDKDDSIEYDSMVLLSKLEQLMIKLSDNTDQRSISLVIEALVEMTNYVVEFTEHLPVIERKKISLKELLDRDEKNYKILSSDYIDNKRLIVDNCTFTNCANPREVFIDLSNDLLRVVNVYLSSSVKSFKSNRVSKQWKTLYTGFFVNLTKLVRSSQTNQKI
jgi:hypothetical protein